MRDSRQESPSLIGEKFREVESVASKKGRSSRRKGQVAERALANELSDLLGITLKRRVRNYAGESDIEGLPGFSVEVKNCATLSVASWWTQTVVQCKDGEHPVLFYKVPRKGFRAVVSLPSLYGALGAIEDLAYTAEMSVPAFAMVYREWFNR
jgi:hypothetical protein